MSNAIAASDRIRLGVAELVAGVSNPTVGAGMAALVGSLYLRTTGETYQKVSAGDTGWSKLLSALEWYNVKDFGAVGDNVIDDTAAIQAAIDACAAAGGGRVYFPVGTYFLGSAITLNGKRAVQLQGSGDGSVLRTTTANTLTGNATTIECRVQEMRLSGAGATFTGSQNLGFFDVTTINCAGAGLVLDGVFKCWVKDCTLTADTYGIDLKGAFDSVWINHNTVKDCGISEFRLDGATAVGAGTLSFVNNILKHTAAGANPVAVTIVGNAASLVSRLSCSGNIVIGGSFECSNAQYSVFGNNVITSGVYASTAPVLTFANLQLSTVSGNLAVRALGAGAGLAFEMTDCVRNRVGNNMLFQELAASGVARFGSCTQNTIGNNVFRNTHATGPTGAGYAVVVDGGTTGTDDMLLQGNSIAAAAGTYKALVQLLTSGAGAVGNVSVAGTAGGGAEYVAEFNKTGAGTFTGRLLLAGTAANTTVGDYLEVGATVFPVIGMNATTFGAQMISGTGSPEGVVTARIGSVYMNRTGGAGNAMYIKESSTGNTGWAQFLNTAPLFFGALNAGAAATALYLAPGYSESAAQAVEIAIPVTKTGTVRNLRVRVGGTVGVGAASVTFTLMLNGVATTMTCAVSNTVINTGAVDVTHPIAVVAGDTISLRVTKSAAVTSGIGPLTASLELA